MSSKPFKNVEFGECFHVGKHYGSGLHSDVQMWMEYRKVSKTQGECVKQVGFGNERGVGGLYPFGPNAPTWDV